MARAVEQHKTKPAKRKSGRGSRSSPSKIGPPDSQSIEDVFFQRWRDIFGSERALQHLEDFLRSRPSWHVSASGEVTPGDPGFWQRATLSVGIDVEGVDCLAVHYTGYVHDPDYSQYDDGRWFLRTVDIIEYEERLASGNNVISDYDPVAEFEREIEGRPRAPPRLSPTTAAPPPVPPSKEPNRTLRRRATKHPWFEICGEIARRCIDPKTQRVEVPTNETKLREAILQWCSDTLEREPADSEVREAVRIICAALRKI
jgi:hypothetical protein